MPRKFPPNPAVAGIYCGRRRRYYKHTMLPKVLKRWLWLKPIANPRVRHSFLAGVWQNAVTDREKMLHRAFKFAAVSKLSGGYFEFGVWNGSSMVAAYHIAQHYTPGINLYAFDSFEGLPDVGRDATDASQQFHRGQFSCSEEQFKKNLERAGVALARIHTVPGWYDASLTAEARSKLPDKTAAIVNIDCDLYESTVTVLRFIVPLVQDGTILLFDDWFNYRGRPDRGEQRAFREWLSVHPEFSAVEYHKFGWSGNSFIIHRNQQ